MKICVIGLGYVGLPLALQFARSGATVLGLDVDPEKIASLNRGESYIAHLAANAIREQLSAGRFTASTDFSLLRSVEAILLCVPTPLTRQREPDLSFVLNTGRALAPHLRRGTLVVLESTTFPGTTEDALRQVLEETSGLKAGADFHLAYSPEREDPGNPRSRVADIPKVVGGFTPACLEKATALYRRAVTTVVPVSSCRVAEATKLLENIFRSVNIALVNELKIVYARMGIDIWEVIEAAKTKPFGFMPFYPGPGLGGHCIPIDPFYLTWKARQYGQPTRFIELAGEINTAMPEYVIHRLIEALNERGRALRGSRILVLGLAYKKDVDDLRESPSIELIELLRERGAKVDYNDPHIPRTHKGREHDLRMTSVKLSPKRLRSYDAVLIATDHSAYDYKMIVRSSKLIIDTRNATAHVRGGRDKIVKA